MKIKVIISIILVWFIIFIFTSISCGILPQVKTITKQAATTNNKLEDTTSKEEESIATEDMTDQIRVTNPLPDQLIQSPLIIEGEARGTWFFEGVFPIILLDADRNVIVVHFAQAQSEWMTEEFVPFKAQIEFEKPSTNTGILILKKDNPSGLSENDANIEIPVRFDNQLGKIVEDIDPQKGEYFVSAILKNIDTNNKLIIVEQLINEPNEKEISPEVKLSEECKIVKVILERPEEKETVNEIVLDSIKLDSEIGIIFKSDNTARAIIYQEIIMQDQAIHTSSDASIVIREGIVHNAGKKIALTFDAGWEFKNTETLLNLLDEFNVKATFFVRGLWVKEHPDLATEIVNRGHALENHSLTHGHMNAMTDGQVKNEINQTTDIIKITTGYVPYLFRPPFGEYDERILRILKSEGYHYTILWTVDSYDWAEEMNGVKITKDYIVNRVLNEVSNGGIILMHVGGYETINALPEIIDGLLSQGYELVKVNDML
jgi:peptidoglycan/xylan/chitin deacetylase (PgdA/CDA1 family)